MSIVLNRFLSFFVVALFSNSAIGLGLGDLVVQSHLGQPLRASIAVLDAPPEIQADCFSLKNGGDASLPGLPSTRIALETRGAKTTLFITTSQTINEPVFQISVSAACADRLQRDYVVLLDPPLATQPETAYAEAVPLQAKPLDGARNQAHGSRSRNTRARDRTAKLVANATHQQPGGKTASAQRPPPKPVQTKLVLSGGHYRPDRVIATATAVGATPLEDTSRPSAMSPTELSDEHTSLKHRVAYLQTQLLALQQRNDELEAARRILVKAPAPAPVAAKKTVSRWTQFLIVLGILTASVALFFGLRAYPRRRLAPALSGPESLPLSFTDMRDAFPAAPVIVPPNTLDAAVPTRATTEPHTTDADAFSHVLSALGTEVNEDILDQAEVYVAHGHASLAIHMLQEYVRTAPTESPVPWLLLLDLLAREGPEAEYRETCIACKKHYNINLSVIPRDADTPEDASLEAYPHVIAHLQHVWGYQEANAFLADLVYDRRDGTRQGFEPDAYREIMLLRSIAEEVGYGQRVPTSFEPSPPPVQNRAALEFQCEAAPRPDKPVLNREHPHPNPTSCCPRQLMTETLLDPAEWPVAQHPASALADLQQRVREAPTVSPIPWLQLLDLLARDNLEAEFLAARTECQSLFNVNLTASVATNYLPGQASLEAYPHVVEQLQAVWQTPDAEYVLSDLIYDQRGGIRHGFDLDAFREILLLHTLTESEIYSV